MRPVVAIVDYGLCNLGSVRRAVEICGGDVRLLNAPDTVQEATHIILPGVGSFPQAMRNLKSTGFYQALKEQAKEGKPFLGICLGMQLLASTSEESGGAEGLGVIAGAVKRLEPGSSQDRVPHIGWNSVTFVRPNEGLARSLSSGANFYFVHSYHFAPTDQKSVLGTSPYCGSFAAIVGSGNVAGVQFHPEKSQRAGFQLLKNFLAS